MPCQSFRVPRVCLNKGAEVGGGFAPEVAEAQSGQLAGSGGGVGRGLRIRSRAVRFF